MSTEQERGHLQAREDSSHQNPYRAGALRQKGKCILVIAVRVFTCSNFKIYQGDQVSCLAQASDSYSAKFYLIH